MKRLAVVLLPLAGIVVSVACSSETIVLAEVPAVDDHDGGEPDHGSHHRCLTSDDCEDGSFCNRRDCRDLTGTCDHYPATCSDEEEPVCGCDGITYWNDCLRRAVGVTGATRGECSVGAVLCDDVGLKCPGSATCARLAEFPDLLGTCGPRGTGRCWILPETCPPPTSPDRWNECGPPDHALYRCQDTCKAIRSGRHFSRAPAACE